jgi:hypothetical protein
MAITKIHAAERLKQTALTDTKGAAAFVQKVFDKYQLGLKVKADRNPDNETEPALAVSGRYKGQEIEFNIILMADGKRPDVVFDVFAWPEMSNESPDDYEAMDVLMHNGMKKKSERRALVKGLNQAAGTLRDSANRLVDYADWLERVSKAMADIGSKYGK